MTPTIDERLASVIRSLSDIVLPALREDASLAREQTQLIIGHLAIIQRQLDQAGPFERQEVEDVVTLANHLLEVYAEPGLQAEMNATSETESDRERYTRISSAISRFLKAAYTSGDASRIDAVNQSVLAFGESRAVIDRKWFSLMGFDAEVLASNP